MLKSVADLLAALQAAEAKALSESAIKHPGVIGEMYEGLTSQILKLPLPKDAGLRVTTGFLKDKTGQLSRQIDCMVVQGIGEAIPHTRHEVIPIENALLTVEVKKSLYSKDLEDAYQNLLSVKNLDSDALPLVKLFVSAFQGITGYHFPSTSEARMTLPFHVQHIYHALCVDSRLPARVVFGYDGFASEQSFRDKFFAFLKERLEIKGYGPASMPNVITSGQFSIFKVNGMPNMLAMQDDKWDILATTNRNPLLLLLESLFCRLNFMDLVPDEIFGDGLKLERANRFISARVIQVQDKIGWEYFYQGKVDDIGPLEAFDQDWSPLFADKTTWIIIQILCKKPIDIEDSAFKEFLEKNQYPLERLLKNLRDSRLAALSGKKLKLLTNQCQCAVLPDGRFIAGENSSGRLTKWIFEFMEKRKKGQP